MMRQENNTHFYKKGNNDAYNIPSEKALKSKGNFLGLYNHHH